MIFMIKKRNNYILNFLNLKKLKYLFLIINKKILWHNWKIYSKYIKKMNPFFQKIKESNFNVIYNVYSSYSSNYIIDIIFSIIEIFQNLSLTMNGLVNKNLIFIDNSYLERIKSFT